MIHVYCISSARTIILSDRPSDQIKERYGRSYEILTSFVSKDSAAIIIPRLLKNYNGYSIVEWYVPAKRKMPPRTAEYCAKLSASRLGKPRPASSNAKTSATMKGKSNFRGKKHSAESKLKTSIAMEGNDNALGLIWCHDPVSGEEKRIADISLLPAGWLIGREYYSIEALRLYH